MCASTAEKCDRVAALFAASEQGRLSLSEREPPLRIETPGRPDRPVLVHPAKVPRRRLGSVEGRVALVHAVAHIEFNAINLALDAAYRFDGMPEAYYRDWIRVAYDESRHFSMMARRLQQLGAGYGDCDAHNGLWEMALATDHDCLQRMALVPRVLEARGLDVTPGMIERLERAGDEETVACLRVILAEEVAHVEIGTRWFRWCCERDHQDAERVFERLMAQHLKGRIKGPLNYDARRAAGFTRVEMGVLEALCKA